MFLRRAARLRKAYIVRTDFSLGLQAPTMNHLKNLEPSVVKAFSIPHDAPPAAISDMKGVASYSWVDNGGVASLAIPGKFSPINWVLYEGLNLSK